MPPPFSPPNLLQYPRPPQPQLPPAALVSLGDGKAPPVMDGNAAILEQPDGGAIIDFNPYATAQKPKSDRFDANLALEMDDSDLNKIANELLIGIQNDEDSRKEALSMLATGIKLLGLVIEDEGSSVSTSTAVEGQSTVRHPLLLDSCLLFQANARGELLPAAGPVKIRDDRTTPPSAAGSAPLPNGAPPGGPSPLGAPSPAPPSALGAQAPAGVSPPPPGSSPFPPPMEAPPPIGHNQGPPLEEPRDEIAEALQKDMNHYLTTTAKEYYPDTDQMLFKVGFGGLGMKKVYNCPIRRRPVSESINLEDFVVSNALTDLGNAIRKTHKIKMPQSTLRRMQLLGVYCDVPLTQPSQSDSPNEVDQAKANIAGVTVQVQDPKDADYNILECYCELDLDAFAPKQFKGKKLPLPYRVTIEKDSRVVLEVKRNWREDDDQCMAKEYFVEFPFVKAFGFYGLGLLHILGNTTKALTAAWRLFIDSGMFACFPGFLYAKGAGRQLTNQFRVPPGGGVGLDIGMLSIKDAVMALPYKDLPPAFATFMTHVEELGQRMGGSAQIAVGEGRQDAPVGTTLALIEQATKPTGAVQKRLHTAQSQELILLKERFRDDPEAFWRFNKRPAMQWQKEQFIKALDDYDMVPVSDPNNPTSLHRAAKAEWLKQTAIAAPSLLDVKKVFQRSAHLLDISDADDLLAPPAPPATPPADPAKMADVALKGQKLQADQQTAQQKQAFETQQSQLELADKQAERASKERVAEIQRDTEQLRLAATLAIHSDKTQAAQDALHMKVGSEIVRAEEDRAHDAELQAREQAHAAETQQRDHGHEKSLAEMQRDAALKKQKAAE